MGNDIGTGSVTVCLLRSETDLKLHTLLIKFLYWTSDQKAIKLNNVGHIQGVPSIGTHFRFQFLTFLIVISKNLIMQF
jgi:hypothetical protein